MSKYLFEVGVEELPYRFIPMAISQLESGFKTFLNENNISFDNIKVMATPRRLAVIVGGISDCQPDSEKIIKGPIATVAYDENKNLTNAGLGFAKKNNLNPENLYVENNYVYAKIITNGSIEFLRYENGYYRLSVYTYRLDVKKNTPYCTLCNDTLYKAEDLINIGRGRNWMTSSMFKQVENHDPYFRCFSEDFLELSNEEKIKVLNSISKR